MAISEETWKRKKSGIKYLYLDCNLTQKQVLKEITREPDFTPSRYQLKDRISQWGFYKRRGRQGLTRTSSLRDVSVTLSNSNRDQSPYQMPNTNVQDSFQRLLQPECQRPPHFQPQPQPLPLPLSTSTSRYSHLQPSTHDSLSQHIQTNLWVHTGYQTLQDYRVMRDNTTMPIGHEDYAAFPVDNDQNTTVSVAHHNTAPPAPTESAVPEPSVTTPHGTRSDRRQRRFC